MSNVQFQQALNSKLAPSPQTIEANKAVQTAMPTQAVQSIPTRAIYQYPQTNIYPQGASTVEDKSGNTVVLNPGENAPVNVYIQNPGGYMGPNYYNQQYHSANNQTNPIAASNLEDKKPKKTKRIVELTDDYIKSLENYLRNQNKDIRMQGLKELVKRFEEDKTRYDDEALNALLNIALQDKSSEVRSLALSLADSGVAKGNSTTLEILKNLRTTKSNFGIDATIANSALLKMSATTKEVEDDSTGKNSIVYRL